MEMDNTLLGESEACQCFVQGLYIECLLREDAAGWNVGKEHKDKAGRKKPWRGNDNGGERGRGDCSRCEREVLRKGERAVFCNITHYTSVQME